MSKSFQIFKRFAFFASHIDVFCACNIIFEICKMIYMFFNDAKMNWIECVIMKISRCSIFYLSKCLSNLLQIKHRCLQFFFFHYIYIFIWFYMFFSINQRSLSLFETTIIYHESLMKFVNNNSKCLWIFMKSSFCFSFCHFEIQ